MKMEPEMAFTPCEKCANTGALCLPCLHNRKAIAKLGLAVQRANTRAESFAKQLDQLRNSDMNIRAERGDALRAKVEMFIEAFDELRAEVDDA